MNFLCRKWNRIGEGLNHPVPVFSGSQFVKFKEYDVKAKSDRRYKSKLCINLLGSPQFHHPSVQGISSTQKGHSFSAPKIPQFNTENPSDSHRKAQFHTKNPSVPHIPHFHTKNPSVHHTPQTKTVLNWGVFGVELRGYWCWTEGFWELKRCGPVQFLLRNFSFQEIRIKQAFNSLSNFGCTTLISCES